VSKNPFVIIGDKDGQRLVNLRKPWLRICKVARLKDVRIHDLRHSFASVGVNCGASLPIIGKLLGHTKSSTTEKYSHLAEDPVRAVNEAMGCYIAAMLAGRKDTVTLQSLTLGIQ
jgi:site-specific recombinase XerD